MVVKKLYWAKYRPKNIEAMILLPRIKNELLNDNNEILLDNNYLFTGSPGLGKTSLAKIIAPSGALHVNASYNSSIDDLREEVIEYCKTGDVFGHSSIDGYKIVFLDEFDGVSQKYQEALRGFIEDFENRVRFIATCNNIGKISDAMLSRFTVIDFNPQNTEEEKYLRAEYIERAKLVIEKNNINITDQQLESIIDINFPDLRSVMNALQRISKNGVFKEELNQSINVDLYNILFGVIDTEKTYNWVISTFGDNVEYLLRLCGRPLSEYIINNKKEYINKLPKLLKITSNSMEKLSLVSDPLVLALSTIYEIQETLK